MGKVVALGQITEEIIGGWVEKYGKREDGYYCKQCGSRIEPTICYISIHLKIFEPSCLGPGKVIHATYPYCPKCDGEIDYAQACFHVGWSDPIMMEGASGEESA